MKMKFKSLLPFLFLAVLIPFSMELYAAEDVVQSPQELQQFVKEQHQVAQQQKQAREQSTEETLNKVEEMNQLAKDTRESLSKAAPSSTEEPSQVSSKPLPTCDCYNSNDPYNYPKNFIYNQQKERTIRLLPEKCQCLPEKTVSNNGNSNKSTNSWDINY
ncbi:MAG: hypothetical protein ABIH77_00110 [Pseudomonadota bacterium]|nr:hypothetical protein [Gammaproteobacteria bacterium]MBU1558368.1 hypothetical protein [Gammaproteobacteria bacterium]MBU1926813.1 hypothetical protein [Gammaproteobacteria bacterium]MBU2546416.1 hypothetical protein [Gammaproteobacteria bacterium]